MNDIDAIVAWDKERCPQCFQPLNIWTTCTTHAALWHARFPLLAAECKRLRHTVETKVPALETAMVLQGEEIARLRKQCDLALGELVCVFREPNPCGECGPCQALASIDELEAQRGS